MNRHKAEWAARKAAKLREEAARLPRVPSCDWRGVRARMEQLRRLSDEARRFERIADRYRDAA